MLNKKIQMCLEEFSTQYVIWKSQEYTYRYIQDRSDKLSKSLIAQKYAINCENKLNSIIAIIACIKANKTAVLLCPEYGEKYNEHIINKTKINNFVCDDTEECIKVISNDFSVEDEINNVAFIIHTSGTTGTAKGVMLTAENIIENIYSTLDYYPLESNSKVIIYRPLYHATTVFGELLTGIIAGATIHVLESKFSIPIINKYIIKNSITSICGTPTFFEKLLQYNNKKNKYSFVKSISVGGEYLTKSIADALYVGFPTSKIFHCYGMTEASPRAIYLPHNLFGQINNCIGVPLMNVSAKIVKIEKIDNKSFEVGEIVLKGNNIMKGYYRDKDSTNEVIQKGWYHTGDLGYKDEKGLFYICGRKDNMCIRSGINVWLHDVENALLENKDIEDVLVVCENSVPNKIKAYIVGDLNEQELMQWCILNMQKNHVPDYLEIVESLEFSQSGKKQLSM